MTAVREPTQARMRALLAWFSRNCRSGLASNHMAASGSKKRATQALARLRSLVLEQAKRSLTRCVLGDLH